MSTPLDDLFARMRRELPMHDGIVAESRWLKVDSEYKSARATLDARRRLLSLAGLSDRQIQALAQKPDRLAEFELTSPIDGMVTGVEITSAQGQATTSTAIDNCNARPIGEVAPLPRPPWCMT